MAISQAMHTGVTGLSVMSDGMSVVANNIANANAKGFKYDRAEFEDLVSQDLNTAGSSQIGRGARLARVRTAHTQGGLAVTDRLTDLAVEGEGFFIVRNPSILGGGDGGRFYTRVGAFNFDKDGYLIDTNEGRMQGYMAKEDGTLSTLMTDYRLDTNSLTPRASDKVVFNLNLDSRIPVTEGEFDLKEPEKTSDFSNSVNIFDSHGNAHAMTTFFKRIATDDNTIKWQYFSTVASKEVNDPADTELTTVASGVVTFNSKGQLLQEEQSDIVANFTKGAAQNQKITIDFGQNVGEEEGDGIAASRSTATHSETVFHSQSGYESGNLKTLRIKPNGEIRGYYTNGIEKLLGALGLATFANVDGLRKAGGNMFHKTLESGEPRVGKPQSGTRGTIFASTLEESNVDMANQFVTMIMTQRGFQANSRSITTTDTMIEEVINMKR